MFDPTYVPDVVDLALVHDDSFHPDFLPKKKFREKFPELEFRIRHVREGIIRTFDVSGETLKTMRKMFPDRDKVLSSFNRDSVICFHGCMDLSGLKVGYQFVNHVDSRLLMIVDPNYARRHSEKFREITGLDYRDDWPCDPAVQLGFITNTLSIYEASGSVFNYFKAMAELRGRK